MKTTLQTALLSLAAIASIFAVSQARADHRQTFNQVESLAARTRNHSRELSNELRSSRFPLPGSQQLAGELAAIYQTADCLRRAADDNVNPQLLARDTQRLAQLVQQVGYQVQSLPIGGWGFSGGGAPNLRNMNRLAAQMQQDVWELTAKVQLLQQYGVPAWSQPSYGYAPGFGTVQPQRPGIAFGPSGFMIGGPRFSIQLGR